MSDRGPLLAAVRDEWEPAKVIADRAGIDVRNVDPKLAVLVQDGSLASALVYRRAVTQPSIVRPDAEAVLRDLRAKLAEMDQWDHGQPPHYARGYQAACAGMSRWLDERGVPS